MGVYRILGQEEFEDVASRILYEDNHLLVINKKVGEIVQGDKTGDECLCETLKAFIAQRDVKPGQVFMGLPHRLDRPVSGITVLAKTSKALERLNAMFRDGDVRKWYWALTCAEPNPTAGTLEDYIYRVERQNKSYICKQSSGAAADGASADASGSRMASAGASGSRMASADASGSRMASAGASGSRMASADASGSRAGVPPRKDAKLARLNYELIDRTDRYFVVEVELLTGRHHQIRCQLSNIGCPIKGDLKYGAPRSNPDGGISLHARRITFMHPVKKTELTIEAPLPSTWKGVHVG